MMRCNKCQDTMRQGQITVERGVRETSYQCPTCSAQHLVVQPCENRLLRLGSLQRCSSGWPDSGFAAQQG